MLLIFTIADIVITCWLRHSNILEFRAWNDLYDKHQKNDVVVMGSSRAFVQFDPYVLDSALNVNSYNLGFNGSGVNRQIIRYKTYCRINKHRPRYIIYNLDFMTMIMTKDFEREQFYPYFYTDREMVTEADKYQHFTFLEKYVPLVRYTNCLFDFHFWDVVRKDEEHVTLYKGFANERNEWDGSNMAVSKDARFTAAPEAVKLFKNFIQEEQSMGVTFVFVYAPVYRELIDNLKDIDIIYKEYSSIAKTFNIKELNYMNDSINYNTRYFYNATHLNKNGAHEFSKQLSKDLKKINFI